MQADPLDGHETLVLMSIGPIEVSPEIQGGAPVFRGTRVPVRVLFDHLGAGASLQEFLKSYPSVTRDQAVAVLDAAEERLADSIRP